MSVEPANLLRLAAFAATAILTAEDAMKRTMVVALLGLGAAPFAAARADTSSSGAASSSAPAPVAVQSEEVIRSPFTVEQIDRTNRRLVVVGRDGAQSTVTISPDAKGFDALKPGDQVALDYYKASVLELHPAAGAAPAHPEQMQHMSAGTGSAGMSHRITVTGQLQAVDPQQGTLRVESVDRQPQTLYVQDPTLKRQLRTLRPGDQVTVTYTEPFAVGLHLAGSQR
jgi:hypothetical protein